MRFWIVFVASIVLLISPLKALEIQNVTTQGGFQYWLVEDPMVPVVSVQILFEGGSRFESEDKLGASDLAANLLTQGAGEMDREALQQAFYDLALRTEFGANIDHGSARFRTLRKNLDRSFDLFTLVLTQPRFEEEDIERVKTQHIAALKKQQESAGYVAYQTWAELSFGDHPYGRPSDGTPETIAAVTREDLLDIVNKIYSRDKIYIAVVGDVSAEEMSPLIDKYLSRLPQDVFLNLVEEIQLAPATPLEVVEKDVPQSTLFFGHQGIRRDHPDFFKAAVLNYVLGGGAGNPTRLYDEVREKRGLAYSVGTSLVTKDQIGLIIGTASTQNARVNETVKVIQEQWKQLAEKGPTEAEVEAAKKYMIGSYALQFRSTEAIAGVLAAIQYNDLGLDYLDKRVEEIEAIRYEDVRAFARSFLKPDDVRFVIVGQPENMDY